MELAGWLRHRDGGAVLPCHPRALRPLRRSLQRVRAGPRTVRHSLVWFPPLTPWESVGYFHDLVGRYHAAGIDEFVLHWPGEWRDHPGEDKVFENVATDVIPRLRQ